MTTKFNPTHNMTGIGQIDVPVIITQKRDALCLVIDANNTQYWVGKYNVEEI
tara:strand:+ start:77 stop:232 length:156 start_codon:yes stop_codon:yes gene_type:complete